MLCYNPITRTATGSIVSFFTKHDAEASAKFTAPSNKPKFQITVTPFWLFTRKVALPELNTQDFEKASITSTTVMT